MLAQYWLCYTNKRMQINSICFLFNSRLWHAHYLLNMWNMSKLIAFSLQSKLHNLISCQVLYSSILGLAPKRQKYLPTHGICQSEHQSHDCHDFTSEYYSLITAYHAVRRLCWIIWNIFLMKKCSIYVFEIVFHCIDIGILKYF